MKCYENYPVQTILISNAMTVLAYILGLYIISFFGIIWLDVYLAFCILLEFRLLSKSCVNCYYYGKKCAFGKGYISSLFFKKSSVKFTQRKITWVDILPDFLITLAPVAAGIYILIGSFRLDILIAIILLIIITFAGNAYVRSSLACKYCKQRELGCPASDLFNKKKKTR